MIDIALFRAALSRTIPAAIEPTDVLTEETLNFLADPAWKPHDVKALFVKTERPAKWMCELKCLSCRNKFIDSVSKQEILSKIERRKKGIVETKQHVIAFCIGRNYDPCNDVDDDDDEEEAEHWEVLDKRPAHYRWSRSVCIDGPLCKQCAIEEARLQLQEEAEAERSRREASRAREEAEQERRADNFEVFAQKYLTPEHAAEHKRTRFKYLLAEYREVNARQVAAYIRAMPYGDFLSTAYWLIVASWVRYQSNYRCSLCPNEGYHIHHRHYKRHGLELEYWSEDLTCLCQSCHQKFHKDPA